MDFNYRAVFEYADVNNNPDTISSLSLEVPETLKQEGNNYIATVGKEIKLNVIIDNMEAIEKKMTWTSSNPDVIEVTQNGTLTIKKESDTPVTIRVVNDKTGLYDEVTFIAKEKTLLKGDVNQDDIVGLYDAFQILRTVILGDGDLSEDEQYIMDYNDDGEVGLYDAFQFLRQVILS